MFVDWNDCEYGAPTIDPKRPYGNSDVEHEIIAILGWEWSREEYENPPKSFLEKANSANSLHAGQIRLDIFKNYR